MTIRKTNKGFSLVELLVVITIMAILSVTAYVALGGQTAKARNSRRANDLAAIQSALEIHFLAHNNAYPANLDGLSVEMPDIPLDPSAPSGTTPDYDQDNNTTAVPAYHYGYAVSGKSYQLGATFEAEDGSNAYEAYIIGNAASDLIFPTTVPSQSCGDADVEDGDTACVPSNIWN